MCLLKKLKPIALLLLDIWLVFNTLWAIQMDWKCRQNYSLLRASKIFAQKSQLQKEHTHSYQALISLIDSKQRRHHNFRGRLITQQLHRTKHRLLWKVKKVLQNIHPSMYSTFRIYMISITLCATVLCCYGWSSSSTSSYWDDPASYSRLRLLSPFWMALLTARTTHFIFFCSWRKQF